MFFCLSLIHSVYLFIHLSIFYSTHFLIMTFMWSAKPGNSYRDLGTLMATSPHSRASRGCFHCIPWVPLIPTHSGYPATICLLIELALCLITV